MLLAYTIERKRKDYYASWSATQSIEITGWLEYLRAHSEAQNNTIKRVNFYVAKAKFYEKHRGSLNERQRSDRPDVREGIDGFEAVERR